MVSAKRIAASESVRFVGGDDGEEAWPGRFFFMIDRRMRVTSSAPAGEETLHGVAENLRSGIVNVGFDHGDGVDSGAAVRSPMRTRSTLAWPGKSLSPAPKPWT